MFLAYQNETAPRRPRTAFVSARECWANGPSSRTQNQPRPLGGLSYESPIDEHKFLPVPETFRSSLDRFGGSHPNGNSRGSESSKRGRIENPVERKSSAGTGRIVALHRYHSGIYLPGD